MKVIFLLGSTSDKEFSAQIENEVKAWGISTEVVVASAHKVPEKVFKIVSENNKEADLVYITVAGRSNGLSGVTAANSVHPVIACPPHKDKVDFMVNINSTLIMPGDTPVMTVVDPINAALAAVRILALKDSKLKKKIEEKIKSIKNSFN